MQKLGFIKTHDILKKLAIVLAGVAATQCSTGPDGASDDGPISSSAQALTGGIAVGGAPSVAAPGAMSRPSVALLSGQARHAPGQLLVKVKSRSTAVASPTAPGVASASAELDAAIATFPGFRVRHGIRRAERLFDARGPSGHARGVPSGTAFDQHVASVKTRFAQRAQRAAAALAAPRLDNIYRIVLDDPKADVEQAARELSQDPNVEYAVPNALARTTYVPSDPLYPQQWSHQATSAQAGWDIEKGSSSVVVAVIDTGVDYTHEDLAAGMVGSCAGGCAAGTGYDFTDVDTAPYLADGWQSLPGEDYVTPDAEPTDFNGHGTHVAGIVGARADNGVGVSGVAPGVRLMPVRCGFSLVHPANVELGLLEMDDLAQGIRYAADHGADVLSMSLGGPDSPVLRDAITYARSLGVVLVAAAGNNASALPSYPAAYDGVIAVAATQEGDTRAGYSNFGAWVDVAAPGGDGMERGILSTVPRAGGDLADASGYSAISGTSMAAPYVSGVAALLLSRDPNRTAEQITTTLRQSTDRPASTEYVGTGRVNVAGALMRPTPLASIAIAAPADGATVAPGTLNLTGSISVPTATSYSLSYAEGLYPTSFTAFGSGTAPINNGTLGTLNTQSFADEKLYTVQVELSYGRQTLRERTHFFLSRSLRAGFPQQIAEPLAMGSMSWSNAATLVDVFGQGRQAIFVGGNNGVFGFAGDGTVLPGWPRYGNGNIVTDGETPPPAVGDLDGDGQLEVVAGMGSSIGAFRAQTGTAVPGFPINLGGEANVTIMPILLSDLDGDGKLEIVVKVVDWAQTNRPLDYIAVFTASGAPFRAWPYRFDVDHGADQPFGGKYPALTAVDLQGDGKKELVALVGNRTLLQPTLYVWNYDGTLASGYPRELPDSRAPLGEGASQSPLVTDIDGDGQFEIGYHVTIGNCNYGGGKFVYKNLDGTNVPGWPIEFRNQVTGTNPSLADLDGDGALETIFATTGGCVDHAYTIEAFRKDGTPMPGFPAYVNEPMQSQLAAADLNGDGLPEVIATTGSGAVHAFTRTGVELAGFPKYAGVPGFTPSAVNACPAVGDVDGDGKADLVATSIAGGVFAWAMPGSVAKGKADWPMSLHDPRHSMQVSTPAAPPPQATLRLTSTWNTGYCAEVTVKNSGTMTTNTWSVDFDLRQSTLQSLWGASYTRQGSLVAAKNLPYNGRLTPGQSAVFGFCGNKTGSSWTPVVTRTTLQ